MPSIVIPTYNSSAHLDCCLRSIARGPIPEVIVVDDGSTDDTAEVVKKYPFVKYYKFEKNKGQSLALNYGFTVANTDYCMAVNDDMIFPKNWYTTVRLTPRTIFCWQVIEKEPSPDFACGDVGRDPKTIDLDEVDRLSESLSDNVIDRAKGNLPFIVNRRDFLLTGGWDGNLTLECDIDFFHKWRELGFEIIKTYSTPFYHFKGIACDKAYDRPKVQKESAILMGIKWRF